ncbi:hypothetical protein SAMN05216228_102891 [Rhizobium tibeticum]|uniref:Uncharacterized protein n=1 Tax=Rhizobium tibeticum TaxID=501024 RepID=A0A1H8TFI8_9HYPH|nr:hypothetical protein RTCCBAU85039_5191 [Rhizobium tibeticum]SEO89697.1 hypothetical protein SAMN05216228_102891 [Rhizobium tibeticum]
MSDSPLEIPLIRVAVVEAGAKGAEGWRTAEIGKAIVFKTEDLNDYRTKNWDSRVYDAMVLIAAVEYCDRLLSAQATAGHAGLICSCPCMTRRAGKTHA